jgi:hypothetical protein
VPDRDQTSMAARLPQYSFPDGSGGHCVDHLCHESACQGCHPRSIHGRSGPYRLDLRRTGFDLHRGHRRTGMSTWRLLPWNVVLGLVTRRSDRIDDGPSDHDRSLLHGRLRIIFQPIHQDVRPNRVYCLCRSTNIDPGNRLLQPSRVERVLALHME